MLMDASQEVAEKQREEAQSATKGTAETYNRAGISSFDKPLDHALNVYA